MTSPASKKAKVLRPLPEHGKGRTIVIAVLIFFLAAALRVLFYLQLQDTPFFLNHFSDTRVYMQLAEDIAFGAGVQRAYFMSPLYPEMLAFIWKLVGSPETGMRLVQAFFGSITAVLALRIGTKIFGEKTGLLTGLLVAAYTPMIFYDGLLLIESVQTVLFTAHLFVMMRAMEKGKVLWWAGAGILLGLSVVTRANILLVLPVFLLLWMFSPTARKLATAKHIAVYTAVALAMLIPSTIHNASEEGAFIPVTSSFGFNLYAGNNASADGFYSMPDPVDLYTDPNGEIWVEGQTGREMNASEVSDWWRDRALVWMGKSPLQAVGLMARKVLLFFHTREIDQLGLSMDFFTSQYGAVIGLPQPVFPLLLVLSMMGLSISISKKEGHWLLPVFFLTYVVATAIFFVNGRLRLPVMPIMIVYSSYAIIVLLRAVRIPAVLRTLLVPILISAAVSVALLLFQPSVTQNFAPEYLRVGEVAFSDGNYIEAESAFRASLEEKSTADGMTNLGNALAAQERSKEAAELYRAALQEDSTSALAWFNFGNLWMQTGKPQYAYGYWKKALQYQPRLAGARRNLGLLLLQAGRLPEAEEQLRQYLSLERDPQKRAEIQRDLSRMRSQRSLTP